MWAHGMGLGRKVRPVALVDLHAPRTVVATDQHFWGARSIKEQPRRARWPVLIGVATAVTTTSSAVASPNNSNY